MDGWIKIHRIFEDWEWYDDSHMVHLYLHLIIKANTKTARWRGMTVKRGQLITSRAKLAAETNMSERNIRTCISRLAKTGEITVKTTSHYSIITISKYESYQSEDTQCNQQNDQQTTSRTTNKRPASDQQVTTNKKDKKDNNILKEAKASMSAEADAAGTDAGAHTREGKTGKAETIDFAKLKDYWNEMMKDRAIPQIKDMTDTRKHMVNARMKTHGKEAIHQAIKNAAESEFLNGGGDRGRVFDFDWIFRPNNFPKVLEGTYNTRREIKTQNNGTPDSNNRTDNRNDARQIEKQQRLTGYAAVAAKFRDASQADE